LKASEKLFRELGHLTGIADVLQLMGAMSLWQGDYATAQGWLEESVALNEILKDGYRGAVGLGFLSELHFRLGNFEETRKSLEKSIAISQRSGESVHIHWAQARLGYLFLRVGEFAQAWTILSENLVHFREHGSIIGVVYTMEGLAGLALRQDDFRKAIKLFAWADATRIEIQNTRPSIEQADYDRDIAAIIEKVGEEDYAVVYSEGEKMMMEEAIILALEA